MSSTKESVMDHSILDEVSKTSDDDLVLSEKPRAVARTDHFVSDRSGMTAVAEEDIMDPNTSDKAKYDQPPTFDIVSPSTYMYAGTSYAILDGEPPCKPVFDGYLDRSGTSLDEDGSPWSPQNRRSSDHFAPLSNYRSSGSIVSASTSGSYMTARSKFTSSTLSDYAISTADQPILETISEVLPNELNTHAPTGPLARISQDYHSYLKEKNLMPPLDFEINWSGKGQHVEFSTTEEVPVQMLSHLGSSVSASVEKVKCKRIILARKTMRCTRNWKAVDALREVEHLHRLRHFHIVQLVGSYLQGRTFSILMYPAADCHLGTFLEDTTDIIDVELLSDRRCFLASTLSCLSSAVAYIHENTTKHMDIKPANILVRQVKEDSPEDWLLFHVKYTRWRIYLADFGLSTSFTAQDHSQTDSPTARTAKYCAPEVFDYEPHGRSADIFSLGCVFLEILGAICGKSPQEFADFRSKENEGDQSFRGNLGRVKDWVDVEIHEWDHRSRHYFGNYFVDWRVTKVVLHWSLHMIEPCPQDRSTAHEISRLFATRAADRSPFMQKTCCSSLPEPYVAA